MVHGLWVHDYHWYIDFLANYSFNALRIPFSVQMVQTNPIPNSITTYQMNTDLANLTSLEVLDKIIYALGEKGILVMLDMHSLEHDGYITDGLWYNSAYPQSATKAAWQTMINRYKGTWNVIAMDVFNEPFDATWYGHCIYYICMRIYVCILQKTKKQRGTGDASTDFDQWCTEIGNMANSLGADWLIFCEGVAQSPPCADGMNYLFTHIFIILYYCGYN